MRFLTKLKKILTLKKTTFLFYFLECCCSFYFGLIFGNLFGTFLNFFRVFLGDSLILLCLILCFELFNISIIKTKYSQSSDIVNKENKIAKAIIIIQNIQLGVLLGFFVDSFKVGS
jgi:uncharacterized membrane protein YbjE (DUF340 family)|uniref:Ycf20 n=1 Tax=Caulerpa verticillata TaxID=177082 RepID=A0A386B0C1_9CHLO|nr:hypothetical protein Ycf20 [Caulerpa verticillata]AYC65140.1 hypothetical protein Ycf20 [Caulerpa verticillata]